MKHLYGWNGLYGCMRFEVFIPQNCTLEEVKEFQEKKHPTFKFWIEEDETNEEN